MDALAGDVPHLQQTGEAVGHVLGIAEGDDPVIPPQLHQAYHGVHLPVPFHLQAVLEDVRLVLLVGAHRDLYRVPLVHPGDIHHFPGNGGGEHAQVLPFGHQVQDAGHIPDKAHVQHAVGLVQHHRLHLVQPDGAPLHMVHQAPWGGHHNLGGLFQLEDLFVDGLPAVETHGAHPLLERAQVPQLVPDLDGQLPGGGQHQAGDLGPLGIGVLDHRDAEGKGLARSGGGLRDHVLPLHEVGDGPRLDRGCLDIALFVDGPHQLRGQVQVRVPDLVVDDLAVDFHISVHPFPHVWSDPRPPLTARGAPRTRHALSPARPQISWGGLPSPQKPAPVREFVSFYHSLPQEASEAPPLRPFPADFPHFAVVLPAARC